MLSMSEKTDTGEYSLSKLFDLHLAPIQAELEHVREAIEKLTRDTIAHSEFQSLSARVAKLEGLDDRVDKLEHHSSVGVWLARQVATIIIALIIGYASAKMF